MQDLASTILAGGSELRPDEFISQFRSKRTTYWLRKIKVEKMDRLIKERPAHPSPSASIPPYPTVGLSGPVMPHPFPTSSSAQGARAVPPKPAPYSVTHSVPPASYPSPVRPTHSFPPSYVHGRNPGPSPVQSIPPPSYPRSPGMPMPQPSPPRPSMHRYPPPTASLYGRSPQQYGAPPPAMGRPMYPMQPYPYGHRPPYPPRT